MSGKHVVVRLTPTEAMLVYQNADGWLDAGACEDGLTDAERDALHKLTDQILKQITIKAGRAALKPAGAKP